VKDKTRKKQYFYNLNDRPNNHIMGKGMAVKIVFSSAVVVKKEKITGDMFQKKQDKKTAR